MIQPTLINLHPHKYNQEFHYYPFEVRLDRCAGSFYVIILCPFECKSIMYVKKTIFWILLHVVAKMKNI